MTPTALTLSLFDIFRDLTTQQRGEVAARMTCREYAAGKYIITAGAEGHVYFLISGKVRACAYSETGKQVHFEDLLPGMLFGELSAIDDGPRTSDCVCTETCQIASLSKSVFLELLREYPSINHAVLVRLVAIVRKQLQRVYEYSTYSVNQRIRFELIRLAHESGEQDGPVTLKSAPTQLELADRVSSHREAVSRELKVLESEGLIIWSRHKRVIVDREGLLKRARVA